MIGRTMLLFKSSAFQFRLLIFIYLGTYHIIIIVPIQLTRELREGQGGAAGPGWGTGSRDFI